MPTLVIACGPVDEEMVIINPVNDGDYGPPLVERVHPPHRPVGIGEADGVEAPD